jgi:RHS repeat-associated protein
MSLHRLLRPPRQRRTGGRLPLILSLAVIAVSLVQVLAPSRAVLKSSALSAAQFPGSFTNYSPPELYGGGAPAETCFVCNSVNSDNVGTAASSVDPNNDINPATGDFSTTDTLFSLPDVGPSFKLDLSYDAQWAQSEELAAQSNPNFYAGAFGWGWGSNFNLSASNSGGNVTVTDVNDAQMTFNLPGYQDSCPVGDYEDFQKYTYPYSAEPYCAPQRVDAQLGYLPAYNAYVLDEHGGKDNYLFEATTGQMLYEGNNSDDGFISINPTQESPGSGVCPGSGVTGCIVATDSGGRSITQAVSSGLIKQVIDPAGNDYTVGFNGDYMTSVTNVAHNNATSYFSYYSGNQSPYNAQIHTLEDPDTNITTIGYNAQGFASDESDALNHDVHYAYGNSCLDPPCLDPGDSQMTTVTYADGETDVDHYFEGLLTASSFGEGSSSNANFETWTYNYTFPGASDQNGDTYERIVQPGAAQSTNTTVVVMDPAGNVYESNDVNGNLTQNMYNDTGGNDLDELCWTARPGVSVPSNATCSTPPAGSTSYTYDQYGNVTSQTDPLGNTTRYGYYETYPANPTNLDGLLCWVAQPSVTGPGSTCTNPSSPAGPAPTGATVYTYDSYGNQTSKTVNYWTSTSLTTYSGNYNAYGEPGYTIPVQGQGSGNSAANPYATTDTYWPWGALETKTAPDTTAVTDTYDAADNLIGVKAPLNEAASYGYNADEQQCWSVKGSATATGSCASPPPNATVTTYQPNTGAPATVTDPLGHETQYFYNDHAYQMKPTEIEDPAQNEITYNAYDAYGNVCVSGPVPTLNDNPAQCNPISGDTAAQYNSAGSELSSTDAMGNKTTYAYTNAGYDTLVTSSTPPMNQTTNYSYDNDGRLVTTNEPNGQAVSVGYNNDGLKCAQAPVSTASLGCNPSGTAGDTVYGYDGANELTSMQDNNGVTGAPPLNNNTYTNGTLTSASDDNGKIVSYLYGYGGEVQCIAYSIGTPSCANAPSSTNAVVKYGYDTALRMTSVTPWTGTTGSNSIGYSYTDVLNPTSVSQINYPTTTTAETLSYQYDAAGNLKSAAYAGPVLNGQSDTFSYNNDEQLSNYSLLGGATSPTVTYSSYKQVTSAQDPGQSAANNYTVTPNGEITQVTQGGTTTKSAAYNQDGGVCWSLAGSSSNGCGTAPTGATAYSYDANGQRNGATTGSSSRSNGWNGFGQMCWTAPTSSSSEACGSAPSGATTYGYAGNGLRVSATTGSSTTPFTWDVVGGGSTPLDLSDGTNDYVYGPLLFGGTAPVEQISNGANPASSFLASTPSGVQAVFSQGGSQTSATSAADKFTYGSITAVGSLVSQHARSLSTLSVSPQNVGDAMVLAVGVFSGSAPTVTSVSGGNATWQKLTNTADSSTGTDTELWLGTVTATGSSNITVTYSGSVSSNNIELNAQEYTNGTGASTAWSGDVAGSSQNHTSSTTVTFPSLTPSASGEAYVGYGDETNDTGGGTTSGFTYDATSDLNAFIYNTNVSSAVSPSATQSPAGESDTVGALLRASVGGSGTGPVVKSISPSSGSVNGGTSVSINGSGFTGATAVHFGGIAASSYTVNSPSSITAVAPAGTAGAVDVTVTAPSNTGLLEQATYSLYGQQTIQVGSDVTPFGFQGSYTDPSGFIYLINRYYDPSSHQFLSIDSDVAATGQPYQYTGDDPLNATDPSGNRTVCGPDACAGNGGASNTSNGTPVCIQCSLTPDPNLPVSVDTGSAALAAVVNPVVGLPSPTPTQIPLSSPLLGGAPCFSHCTPGLWGQFLYGLEHHWQAILEAGEVVGTVVCIAASDGGCMIWVALGSAVGNSGINLADHGGNVANSSFLEHEGFIIASAGLMSGPGSLVDQTLSDIAQTPVGQPASSLLLRLYANSPSAGCDVLCPNG